MTETRTVKLRGAASDFAKAEYPECLIVGPAGCGKTRAILEVFHDRLMRYPGSRAIIVRKFRSSLTETGLVTYEEQVLGTGHPIRGSTRRENRHAYHYPNGSTLVVEGCDKPERLFSSEYDGIYVQEAIELELDEWESLARALRNGKWPFQQLVGDTNPSYPGHWLRKRLDERKTTELKSWIQDNPAYWDVAKNLPTQAGERYLLRLAGLSGVRRKRLLDGVWAAADELWFDQWDEDIHVTPHAEYDPNLPVRLAVDPGVYTGVVWFQVRPPKSKKYPPVVSVFENYLAEGLSAKRNASNVVDKSKSHGVRKIAKQVCDPAANARIPTGVTTRAEYEAAGMALEPWPLRPVNDGLEAIASLLETQADDGLPALRVHPRCQLVRDAFASYARAKRDNQWLDKPLDPQHPHEDVMDALRGGIVDAFPDGIKPEAEYHWVPARKAW